jgi:hypothetical protein
MGKTIFTTIFKYGKKKTQVPILNMWMVRSMIGA